MQYLVIKQSHEHFKFHIRLTSFFQVDIDTISQFYSFFLKTQLYTVYTKDNLYSVVLVVVFLSFSVAVARNRYCISSK